MFFSGNYSTLSDFLKKLLSQSISAANLLNLAFMKNFRIFPWKPHLLFFWKNPSFASFENFYYFSRSLQQISYVQILAVYRKKLIFCFEKAIFYSLKITKFWTFREKLLFQSHSTPTFLPLATFKKIIFFLEKRFVFFQKTQTLHVLRNFTISVAFYGKFSTFNFKRFWKISIFCVKEPIYFCLKKKFARFENFY